MRRVKFDSFGICQQDDCQKKNPFSAIVPSNLVGHNRVFILLRPRNVIEFYGIAPDIGIGKLEPSFDVSHIRGDHLPLGERGINIGVNQIRFVLSAAATTLNVNLFEEVWTS